jgi:peptidoglycan-associated lipoprotein
MNKFSYCILCLATVLIFACNPAKKQFDLGTRKFDQGEYQLAIDRYQQSLSKKGLTRAEMATANFKIAEAYRRSNRINEAEGYYKKAIGQNVQDDEAAYYYGYALKANSNYEGAIAQFNNYINNGKNFDLINRAKAEVENLKILENILAKKNYFKVENVDKINSKFAEYSPFFATKGNKLYYTANHEAEKTHSATGTGFTDIYEYVFDGVSKFSGQGKLLPEIINTKDAHEATPILSRDGRTLIFSRGNNGSRKGAQNVDIFTATLEKDGTWSEPRLLGLNDPLAWDGSPCLSNDGKKLYFASDREHPDAKGGNDIYVATRDSKGDWTNVKNLGAPINTRGDDLFPYEDTKGNFYFSSTGHPSFGGLDLFKVDKKGEELLINNMGKPLNSNFDDFAITFKDSIVGYFCSNRQGGEGDDDIYEFTDFSMIRLAHYMVDGQLNMKKKGDMISPLDGAIVKITNLKGDTIAKLNTKNGGKFSTELEPEQVYTIYVEHDECLKEKPFKFSMIGKKVPFDKLQPGDNEFRFPFSGDLKEAVGAIIRVNNINYDFNKADIRSDAAVILDSMVYFLNENPNITVELGSHSDTRGSSDYNRNLSQRRAQSAVDYIISKGISSSRIVAKGYGEDKPIVPDSQINKVNKKTQKDLFEELHAKNRRTEFRVTGLLKDKKAQLMQNKFTE